MEKVHRAEDYFRKVIYDKLHFCLYLQNLNVFMTHDIHNL